MTIDMDRPILNLDDTVGETVYLPDDVAFALYIDEHVSICVRIWYKRIEYYIFRPKTVKLHRNLFLFVAGCSNCYTC